MKGNVILTCDQKPTWVRSIYSTEQQQTGENRKSGRLKSENGYAQKYRQTVRGIRGVRWSRTVTDNSTNKFWRWQVVCYGYADDFQHILTRYVEQWLLQCFCYSPLGILKYDFLPVGDIQLKKVIRCSPCCNVVHFLLARAGVDW